jgi:hypothetical protein
VLAVSHGGKDVGFTKRRSDSVGRCPGMIGWWMVVYAGYDGMNSWKKKEA